MPRSNKLLTNRRTCKSIRTFASSSLRLYPFGQCDIICPPLEFVPKVAKYSARNLSGSLEFARSNTAWDPSGETPVSLCWGKCPYGLKRTILLPSKKTEYRQCEGKQILLFSLQSENRFLEKMLFRFGPADTVCPVYSEDATGICTLRLVSDFPFSFFFRLDLCD